MRKRYLYGSGLALLAILVTLVVWQMSFTFGEYAPANPAETFVFWAVSTLIFLLTVTLGFMLFRTGVKLYLERQKNKEGSRIQTKLVLGALAAAVFGIVLGTLVKDMNALFTVVKSMAILLYAPAIIQMIPQLPQALAQVFPTYYIIGPIQDIALNGASLGDISGKLAILLAMIGVLLFALVTLVERQARRQVLFA